MAKYIKKSSDEVEKIEETRTIIRLSVLEDEIRMIENEIAYLNQRLLNLKAERDAVKLALSS